MHLERNVQHSLLNLLPQSKITLHILTTYVCTRIYKRVSFSHKGKKIDMIRLYKTFRSFTNIRGKVIHNYKNIWIYFSLKYL